MVTRRDLMRDYRVRDRQNGSPTQGQTFTYGRRLAQLTASPQNNNLTWYEQRLTLLRKHVYLPLHSNIILVGAGYGFLHEVMLGSGYRRVISIDNSDYLDRTRLMHVPREVRNNFIQASILDDLSYLGTFDFAVTEDMVSSIRWRDYETFFTNVDTLANTTVHLVTSDVPPRYTQRILKTWHRKYPRHIWIDLASGEVL